MFEWITITATSAVAVVGSVLSFFAGKNTNKKDLTIESREQLSKDEQEFREKILDRVDKLQKDVDKYSEEALTLKDEIIRWKDKYIELDRQWRMKYTDLEIENRQLHDKVATLEELVKRTGIDQGYYYKKYSLPVLPHEESRNENKSKDENK